MGEVGEVGVGEVWVGEVGEVGEGDTLLVGDYGFLAQSLWVGENKIMPMVAVYKLENKM
jgi:hypothetical protein